MMHRQLLRRVVQQQQQQHRQFVRPISFERSGNGPSTTTHTAPSPSHSSSASSSSSTNHTMTITSPPPPSSSSSSSSPPPLSPSSTASVPLTSPFDAPSSPTSGTLPPMASVSSSSSSSTSPTSSTSSPPPLSSTIVSPLTASRRFDGSIPTHVPKFIVDTLQGIDPQQGELLALEYHTQMGYFIERVISKRDLAQTLDVEPRDLRKVLSASQRRLISGVNVREKCIILHLEHVKAIIMSDRMFLFDHTRDARVKTFSLFLPSLLYEQRTTNGSATAVATANGVNGNLPFELRALEAVLIEVTESLDAMLKEMTPRMLELLHDLTVVQSTANLSALVSANDSLSSFDARVQSLRHALTELLNNDEDLAGLFLTEKRATQDHGEAEELVENYLMQVEETSERIAELQTRFRNVMSYIQIHFDSQRNRLMRMSLVVSLGALSCSTTATGAGLFGMNLMSGLESSPHAFYAVSGTLLSIGALLFSGSYMLYRRTKRLDVDFSDHITNFKHK